MSLFVGVDPGVSGAVAVIDSTTRVVSFWDTPVVTVKSGKHFKSQLND